MHYVRILICAAVAVLVAQAASSFVSQVSIQYGISLLAFVAIAIVSRPWYDPESLRAQTAAAEREQLERELDELRRENSALRRQVADAQYEAARGALR